MENMEDFCVSHSYTETDLLLPPSSSTLQFEKIREKSCGVVIDVYVNV
jgi:hypothetical protein